MRSVDPGETFESWRDAARRLLAEGVPPGEVLWEKESGLFGGGALREEPPLPSLKVPASVVGLARRVACNADPARWALLYRILWRVVRDGERHLPAIASDSDMAKARAMEKAVRREIHKMHAFVRFRQIDPVRPGGRERYVAWFEPDHWIVEAATPFFRDRFATMDWSIFTPKGCAHWDGESLVFTRGVPLNPIEHPDVLEDAWRTYYRAIHNPARVKVKAMQAEMPKRYWKNLPEADLIDELIAESRPRVEVMHEQELRPAKPLPGHSYLEKLHAPAPPPIGAADPPDAPLPVIAEAAARCRGCPLWKNATATVFGEGPPDARIMIVGEQPGDREDVAGRVFVGPAGQVLDEALIAAGIDRKSAYLTNAVKHFKWTPRGKFRLHQKPDSAEVEACRPWVLAELSRIAPDVLVLLGATAARSLLGKDIAVTRQRGIHPAPELAPRVIVTVHPSYLLRLPAPARKAEQARFVEDLRLANP